MEVQVLIVGIAFVLGMAADHWVATSERFKVCSYCHVRYGTTAHESGCACLP